MDVSWKIVIYLIINCICFTSCIQKRIIFKEENLSKCINNYYKKVSHPGCFKNHFNIQTKQICKFGNLSINTVYEKNAHWYREYLFVLDSNELFLFSLDQNLKYNKATARLNQIKAFNKSDQKERDSVYVVVKKIIDHNNFRYPF